MIRVVPVWTSGPWRMCLALAPAEVGSITLCGREVYSVIPDRYITAGHNQLACKQCAARRADALGR